MRFEPSGNNDESNISDFNFEYRFELTLQQQQQQQQQQLYLHCIKLNLHYKE